MARPSKLTDKQWHEIVERVVAGEAIRAIAREFKVSESTIRERVSAQAKEIKNVANQIVSVEQNLRALPISAQITAQTLASQIRAMQEHLAGAAMYGASTSHRLAGIANMKSQEIDDAAPLDEKGRDAIRDIAALTKTANDAASIAIDLVKANKDSEESAEKDISAQAIPDNPQGAARAYQWLING